jgi:triphosphatase
MSEIEIKFVTRNHALSQFEQHVIPSLTQQGIRVEAAGEKFLQNDYYDTPAHAFKKRKIGMRVRGCDGVYEQTVKTHGQVRAGLHERAEYNLPLPNDVPDLRKFAADIWPQEWNIDEINANLTRQFSTHFKRTIFNVYYHDATIELVFDVGNVITDSAQSGINEIELELHDGELTRLFDLANEIMAVSEIRLSDTSKAAQGYELLHGVKAEIKLLPSFLPLDEDESTEDAFCKAVDCAIKYWQHHEHLYFESGSAKMLNEIARAIRLLLQSVSLYLPVLQCPQMLAIHKQLSDYAETWMWQEDLQGLRYLLSKKSLFQKKLSRYPALLSYLQGRSAGLLQAHEPETLLYDSTVTGLKLSISELLYVRPWRESAIGFDAPVMEHAKGWLSQGWQTVHQSMPMQRQMKAGNYIAVDVLLRQSLLNGFLLADLFSTSRDHFLAPWVDILTGIDELKALYLLQSSIHDAEIEEQQELLEWTSTKIQNLLKVMERSRNVAIHVEVYW